MVTISESEISIDDYRSELERLSVNLAAMVDQPLIIPKSEVVTPKVARRAR